MRVKRNTKKIIRRKGSKKNLKKHLKKYVGGAGMDEILANFTPHLFDENGKLTEEAKGNIGFLFSAALAGGTIWGAILTAKVTVPESYKIIVNIIYNIGLLLGYRLPVEATQSTLNVVTIAGTNLYYILKSLIALLWPWRYCGASAALATAGPTVYSRIADTIQSIRGSTNPLQTDIARELTEIENIMTIDNLNEKVLDLIYWVIEKSNTAVLDTSKTISDIYQYFKDKDVIDKEIDDIQKELDSAKCGIGGKDESEDSEEPSSQDIIKNLEIIIDSEDTDNVISEGEVTEAKNFIDLTHERLMENLKKRIDALKTEIYIKRSRYPNHDKRKYKQDSEVEILEKVSINDKIYPFSIDKFISTDDYKSEYDTSQDNSQHEYTPGPKPAISLRKRTQKGTLKRISSKSSDDEESDNESSDGEESDGDTMSGGKKKKNTQKRRNKVSRKHRK